MSDLKLGGDWKSASKCMSFYFSPLAISYNIKGEEGSTFRNLIMEENSFLDTWDRLLIQFRATDLGCDNAATMRMQAVPKSCGLNQKILARAPKFVLGGV